MDKILNDVIFKTIHRMIIKKIHHKLSKVKEKIMDSYDSTKGERKGV
jgi:hypothetical protein